MATATDTTTLAVKGREAAGSRASRRLRHEGLVPGIVYGGGEDPAAFQVEARALRLALAHGGAVIDLSVDGSEGAPVVVKDQQTDPVTGAILHLDLLRVRLDRPIQATTILELTGADDAPGVKEGGTLEQITRELNVEALPTAIPDMIEHDVSGMQMNDTLMLAALSPPEGVALLDDPDETVLATLSPPRVEEEPDSEIEQETLLVGQEGEADAASTGADGAPDSRGDSGE
ncbi:MAG: 50S ribosomal protein L25 [Actinomycetota bacterium]|nr:50S ribosomal protein L25 [Actinomycetota bacterium]